MITLIKYPEDQDKKQKVYRAVTRAVDSGAVKKDMSVVLEADLDTTEMLKQVCRLNDAAFAIIDTQPQTDPKLQAKFDLQAKILLFLAKYEKIGLTRAIEALDLTKEELQEALA